MAHLPSLDIMGTFNYMRSPVVSCLQWQSSVATQGPSIKYVGNLEGNRGRNCLKSAIG